MTKLIREDEDGPEDEAIHEREDSNKKTSPGDDKIHEDGPED